MSAFRAGFTLVELAIVLVIIGLLVGGVLVGQDLIKSAQINAIVSDIQSYTAAVGTFRDKYGGIPGDLSSAKAQQAGLAVSATSPGTVGEGDGDGVLMNGAKGGTSDACGLGGETALFWRHLSDTGLIAFTSVADGSYVNTTSYANNSGAEVTGLTSLIPALRTNGTGFIHVYSYNGLNYYNIDQWTNGGDSGGLMSAVAVLTGREAQGIDQKLDDGIPSTGTVLSARGNPASAAAPANGGTPAAANTICYLNSTTPTAYGTSTDAIASSIRCGLQIRIGL